MSGLQNRRGSMRHVIVVLVAALSSAAASLQGSDDWKDDPGDVGAFDSTTGEGRTRPTPIPELYFPTHRPGFGLVGDNAEARSETGTPDFDSRTRRSDLQEEEGEGGGGGGGGGGQISLADSSPEMAMLSRQKTSGKDYLNGLVAASALKTNQQKSNIAFVKTHKTASTTLAYLLYRYARRHGVKLAHFSGQGSAVPLRQAVEETNRPGGPGPCDIMHYHVSAFGNFRGNWKDAEESYRHIVRDPDTMVTITVMREPRSHLLSYYYYYIYPERKVSIEKFLTSKKYRRDPYLRRLANPLAAEFGAHNLQALRYMLEEGLPKFSLVILTEEFEEGLMVMRRLLGWDMIDMTYRSMYKTETGHARFDGKQLHTAPSFEELPEKVQTLIDKITMADQLLYQVSKMAYKEKRDSVAQYLEADLAEFRQLQGVVTTYLEGNKSSEAHVMYRKANIYGKEMETTIGEF